MNSGECMISVQGENNIKGVICNFDSLSACHTAIYRKCLKYPNSLYTINVVINFHTRIYDNYFAICEGTNISNVTISEKNID